MVVCEWRKEGLAETKYYLKGVFKLWKKVAIQAQPTQNQRIPEPVGLMTQERAGVMTQERSPAARNLSQKEKTTSRGVRLNSRGQVRVSPQLEGRASSQPARSRQ